MTKREALDYVFSKPEVVEKYNGKSGIYVIFIDQRIAYIGQAESLIFRLASHIQHISSSIGEDGEAKSHKYQILRQAIQEGHKVSFDVLCYCPIAQLEEKESYYIWKYQPPLCQQYPLGYGKKYKFCKRAKYVKLEEILKQKQFWLF